MTFGDMKLVADVANSLSKLAIEPNCRCGGPPWNVIGNVTHVPRRRGWDLADTNEHRQKFETSIK